MQYRSPRSSVPATGVAVLLVCASCTGSIGSAGGGDPSSGSGGGDSGGNSGAAGATAGTGATGANAPVEVPTPVVCSNGTVATPLRRLSHSEFFATMRDLLPASVALTPPVLLPDAKALGFENRAALLIPVAQLVEQYRTAAVDASIKVAAQIDAILPCPQSDPACADKFIADFGQRALRRPLTAEEKTAYLGFFNAEKAATTFAGAVQQTVAALLLAPEFLYRIEEDAATAKLTGFQVASRLSYLLWGSLPDAALFDAAANGGLDTPAEREAHARRMLADPRSKDMMVDFHRQWLDFDRLAKEPKDAKTYPEYTASLQAAILEESKRFVAQVMFNGDGTLKSLFTSAKAEVNAEVAKLYGVAAPASGWAAADLDPAERAGILTRATFLASRAHRLNGNPILRSVLIRDRLLCLSPLTVPAAANLAEPALSATLTNRQSYEERTKPAECSACHSIINPMGFAFENFDAIGRYRTTEQGVLPVNASVDITSTDDSLDGHYAGAIDLSQKLAQSPPLETCAAETWFQFAAGRNKTAADECRLRDLGEILHGAGGDVRAMLLAIVKSPEFVQR